MMQDAARTEIGLELTSAVGQMSACRGRRTAPTLHCGEAGLRFGVSYQEHHGYVQA